MNSCHVDILAGFYEILQASENELIEYARRNKIVSIKFEVGINAAQYSAVVMKAVTMHKK